MSGGPPTDDPHARHAGPDTKRAYEVQRYLGCSTHSFADATDWSIGAVAAAGIELGWYEISRLSGSFCDGTVDQFEALLVVGHGPEPSTAAAPPHTAPEWSAPALPAIDDELGPGRIPVVEVVGVHEASFSQAAIEGVAQAGKLFDRLGWTGRSGRFDVIDMSGKVVDGRRAEYRITLRVWPT